jgi:hypothetical protein
MKSLDDIKQDLSDLYDALAKGEIELKQAMELANVAGKFLKAEQLVLAREVFLSNRPTHAGPALLEHGE